MNYQGFYEVLELYKAIETPEDYGYFALFLAIIARLSSDDAVRAAKGKTEHSMDKTSKI